MGVIRYSMLAVVMIGAIQARHPVSLVYYPAAREPKVVQPKTFLQRYFGRQRFASEPTFIARLKTGFYNWLTAKPQATVLPMTIENTISQAKTKALQERDEAVKAVKNAQGSEQVWRAYDNFLKAQDRAYHVLQMDLALKEAKLEQKMQKDYRR